MSDAVKDDTAIVYFDGDLRKFLIASTGEKRNRYCAQSPGLDPIYGFANTEHQFRKALCEALFPTVEKLTRSDMQNLMAEELTRD